MTVLYITNHLNTGGITSYLLTLAAGMKKLGHRVFVASSGGDKLPVLLQAGIEFIEVPIKTKQEVSLKVFLTARRLARAIKENRIELVHTNSRTTQIVGCLLKNKMKIPHVTTCHGFFKPRLFRRLFPSWGDKVIAISEPVRDHLIKDFAVNDGKIVVIHNGIDVGRFKISDGYGTGKRQELGLSDGPVIGIVARLSDVKGHKYLIQAMPGVLAQFAKAQLLIVGEGKMREELLALTKKLGISKSVCFVSQVSDTREVLSLMDVFVMPSLEEGLGLALMEAMASGLAVVGSDVGGITSLIQNGSTGLLVKSKDSKAFAQAIIDLLSNARLAKALGEKARSFIQQHFSQEDMVTQTEKVYRLCLNSKAVI